MLAWLLQAGLFSLLPLPVPLHAMLPSSHCGLLAHMLLVLHAGVLDVFRGFSGIGSLHHASLNIFTLLLWPLFLGPVIYSLVVHVWVLLVYVVYGALAMACHFAVGWLILNRHINSKVVENPRAQLLVSQQSAQSGLLLLLRSAVLLAHTWDGLQPLCPGPVSPLLGPAP